MCTYECHWKWVEFCFAQQMFSIKPIPPFDLYPGLAQRSGMRSLPSLPLSHICSCSLFPSLLRSILFSFLFFPHLGPRSHVLHCLTKNSCGKVKHPEKFSYEKSIKKILRWCVSFSFSTSLSVAVSSLILTLTFR